MASYSIASHGRYQRRQRTLEKFNTSLYRWIWPWNLCGIPLFDHITPKEFHCGKTSNTVIENLWGAHLHKSLTHLLKESSWESVKLRNLVKLAMTFQSANVEVSSAHLLSYLQPITRLPWLQPCAGLTSMPCPASSSPSFWRLGGGALACKVHGPRADLRFEGSGNSWDAPGRCILWSY